MGIMVLLVLGTGAKLIGFQPAKSAPEAATKGAKKDSVAAELTRTKLLKTRVEGSFKDVRIGDILKEFAAQVDMKADQPVMWSYGEGFPFSKSVTFVAKDLPLEIALDQLLTKSGGTLGYYVVSKDWDKRDGWIQLTTTGERGMEPQPATAEEEALANERLIRRRTIRLADSKPQTRTSPDYQSPRKRRSCWERSK